MKSLGLGLDEEFLVLEKVLIMVLKNKVLVLFSGGSRGGKCPRLAPPRVSERCMLWQVAIVNSFTLNLISRLKLLPPNVIFWAELNQIRFRPGLRPRPSGGAHSTSPDPLAGFKEFYF